MREAWKIFYDAKTGDEYFAYTINGTFDGEEEATKELLAYQHGIEVDQIKTEVKFLKAHK